jgi:type III restriction enzyme
MDYTPDPETGLLTEEYVDVYGIPFSVIPYKGRETEQKAPEDKPKNHVRALPERKDLYEIRFPVVEGYVFELRRNVIKADIDKLASLELDPSEPTVVFVKPQVGYQTGKLSGQGPGKYEEQDREEYYASTHIQAIEFEIARQIVNILSGVDTTADGRRGNADLRRRSRAQLFPQVLQLVQDYVSRKVRRRGVDLRELGHQRYVTRIVERLVAAIEPDETQGEPPLLPILNRYKPIGTTAEVDFKTTKPCHATERSHVNQAPVDTATWEKSAAFRLEQAKDAVNCYVRNEGLGFQIPYQFEGVSHWYEPDYLVRLTDGRMLVLEVKGHEPEKDKAKHDAANRWISAVTNWGGLGEWTFWVNKDPQLLGHELRYLIKQGQFAAD